MKDLDIEVYVNLEMEQIIDEIMNFKDNNIIDIVMEIIKRRNSHKFSCDLIDECHKYILKNFEAFYV